MCFLSPSVFSAIKMELHPVYVVITTYTKWRHCTNHLTQNDEKKKSQQQQFIFIYFGCCCISLCPLPSLLLFLIVFYLTLFLFRYFLHLWWKNCVATKSQVCKRIRIYKYLTCAYKYESLFAFRSPSPLPTHPWTDTYENKWTNGICWWFIRSGGTYYIQLHLFLLEEK